MVCASTGLTAQAIGGGTIHSMASLQRGQGLASTLVNYMSEVGRNRLKKVRVMLIDEVSILGRHFFDLLEEVLQLVRGNQRSFGGVRMILLGDFAQLPSVPYFEEMPNGKIHRRAAGYAFDSLAWQGADLELFELTHCWRYDQHGRLGQFLLRLRLSRFLQNDLYEEASALLVNQLVDEERAVHLACTRRHAKALSMAKLNQLAGPEYAYQRIDRRAGRRHVCSFVEEDRDRIEQGNIYHDENGRQKSLFSSLP